MLSSTFNTILATLMISGLSLIGIFTLSLHHDRLHKILLVLVAFSAGTILGVALFDLLPEAIEIVDEHLVFPIVAVGFVFFLLLERFLYWYHGHGHMHNIDDKVQEGPAGNFAYLNLIGDFIHNFIDGMIIASAFVNGFGVGVATSIAVALHELPQEMGDYGILVYSGMERRKALILNFIAALSIVVGGVFGSFFLGLVESLSGWMVAFSAGAFIFLSAGELIPEMHEEKDRWKNLLQIIVLLIGMLTIFSLGIILPHE
jgi:zinc and cadmium transporter